MNVVFFSDTFMPKIDGIVTSILNTAGELLRRGHRVMIVAPRIRKNQEEIIKKYDPRLEVMLISGLNALFYPDYRLTPPMAPFVVSRLKKFGADLLHFHTPFTMGLESIFASRLMGLPLVGTFHTFFIEPEYLKIVKLHWVPGLVRFGWTYSNFFHDRCDMTVSPSRFTADELERKKMKSPLTIISNGVPLQEGRVLAEAEKDEIRKRYGLKGDVMLFIGRVSEEKCIDVLIKAARIVFGKRDNASLLLVGDGPAREKLAAMARDEGISDRVAFAGAIPHDELIRSGIFETSCLFATASTSENQPMTIIEACMFGLPVIGVDAKGVPEMIDGNGFVAKPCDPEDMACCMLRLLEDNALREAQSRRSIELGREYDIKRTTDRMIRLYEGLIEKKRPANGTRPVIS
jgi:glycosyltransferase involved in cell wall biosynthesis